MRCRHLLLLALLLVVVALFGCGGDTGSTDSTGDGSADGVAADAASLETFLQDNYGDTAWFAAIDRITATRKLRHPVTEVWFAVTVQEARDQYNMDLNTAISEWVSESQESLYVDVYGTDGKVGGFGNQMGDPVNPQLPAAPTSIDGLEGWMDAAYGPGSGDTVEDWYTHITGYETGEDQYSGETIVRVLSDLTYSPTWTPDAEMAELMRTAIATAGITWATQVEVVFADGENISHSGIEWPNPYEGY